MFCDAMNCKVRTIFIASVSKASPLLLLTHISLSLSFPLHHKFLYLLHAPSMTVRQDAGEIL
jgi:hypothetical protein